MSLDSKRPGIPPFYWRGRLHFYASAYLCTAGLTNLNWFPYAIYKRGRGSFLAMYAVVMSVLIVPMLHMEAIVGQFSHCGNRGALECSPAFIGLSYTMAYFHVVTSVSGALSMSYAALYLLGSNSDPLPWSTCGRMNTTSCYVLEATGPRPCHMVHRSLALRFEGRVERDRQPVVPVVLDDRVVLVPKHQFPRNCTPSTLSAVEHYHRDFVLRLDRRLDGLRLNPDVALAHAATWAIALVVSCLYIALSRAVTYALVVVRVFLVWFVCAKVVGAGFKEDLWKQLSSFDPAQLLDLQSWKLATERSLYSVGCSRSFLRLASWNKFFGDVRCVAPILAWTNFATTLMSTAMVFLLLSFISERTDTDLDEYFEPKDAPFVSVVQALLFLEPERSFSLLYFSLMLCTGICDLIIVQEVVLEVLVVDFPAVAERTVMARGALCLLLCALSMPLCTGAGPYLADLLDYNFKGSLYLILNLVELLVFTRVYGVRRLLLDAQMIMNGTPNLCLRVAWKTVLPISFVVLLLSGLFYTPRLSYNGYVYPSWAKDLVFGLALAGMGFIPAYAIAALVKSRWESSLCLMPSVRWGPNPDAHVECQYAERLQRGSASSLGVTWSRSQGPVVRHSWQPHSYSSVLSPPPEEGATTAASERPSSSATSGAPLVAGSKEVLGTDASTSAPQHEETLY